MSRITDLTASSSLAGGDLTVVVDIDDATMDATGTDKKLAISDLATFIRGVTASAVAKPGNPAATASTTLVMMGLGGTCQITPSSTGKVQVILSGEVFTATAAVVATFGGRFGTGAAPVSGAAVTGTRFGSAADLTAQSAVITAGVPFTLPDLLTLTPGTAYWFDLAVKTANAADAADFYALSFLAVEVA